MLNGFVAEIVLNPARIVACIGQGRSRCLIAPQLAQGPQLIATNRMRGGLAVLDPAHVQA